MSCLCRILLGQMVLLPLLALTAMSEAPAPYREAMDRGEDLRRDSGLGFNRFEKAESEFKVAMEHAETPSQTAKALMMKARTYYQRHLFSDAISLYQRVLQLDPEEVDESIRIDARLWIGRSYVSRDWYPEAAVEFGEAASMDGATPDQQAEAYLLKGRSFEDHHDFGAAFEAYEQADSIEGVGSAGRRSVESARLGMARCLKKAGRPEAAVEFAENLLAQEKVTGRNEVHAHFVIARALQNLGEHERAIEVFEASGATTGYDPDIKRRGIEQSRQALAEDEPVEEIEGSTAEIKRDRGVLNAMLVMLGYEPADEDAGLIHAGVRQSRERLIGDNGDIYADDPRDTVTIGTRTELMVDHWLIDEQANLSLIMNRPQRREKVLEMDKPWERRAAGPAYVTVFEDDGKIRMYYRGHGNRYCYAESEDGVNFVKPALGLHPVGEHEQTNIVLEGPDAHNFAPFKDTRPGISADERYKALGGRSTHAYRSSDGLRWEKMQEESVLKEHGGLFDSQNVAFWHEPTQQYLAYGRTRTTDDDDAHRIRSIRSFESDDFLNWESRGENAYPPNTPLEHHYTNATVAVPGAEHMLFSFPRRFIQYREGHERNRVPYAGRAGLADVVFMTSRDGVEWDRSFREAWLRPGRDFRNWTAGMMPAWGIVATGPDEHSMYIDQHYGLASSHILRLSIPRHRFASWSAGHEAGEFVTRPLVFGGKHLILNHATSAGGTIFVELRDKDGTPLKGYSLKDSVPMYGNDFDGVVSWAEGDDLSDLAGATIRVRIVMQDADLYSLRFAETPEAQRLD